MPLPDIDLFMKMFDVAEKSVKLARQIRQTSPIETANGVQRCFFCKVPVVDVNGSPFIAHEQNCAYDRANRL